MTDWTQLFDGGDSPRDLTLRFRVLSKGGRPLLMLPGDPGMASRAMALYPAQRGPARIARTLIRQALRLGLPLPCGRCSVAIASRGEFAGFLTRIAGTGQFPGIAILAGNANAEGRRFIIAVFDKDKKPVAVIKAGAGERARALIEAEASFLAAAPGAAASLPRLRERFDSGTVSAIALDFFEGDSPRDSEPPAALLASWIDRSRTIAFAETAAGRALGGKIPAPLLTACFHPVLQHGDFAPWNIKVGRDGSWRVLDWERGQLAGVSGWDWFHYLVQSAALVRDLETGAIIAQLRASIASPPFQDYAARAGISGMEGPLVSAYLLHCTETLKQTEGMKKIRALAAAWG